MAVERKIVTEPQLPKTAGYTVNVLVSLGNCFELTCGHNKLSLSNLALYLSKSYKNVPRLGKSACEVYRKDLNILEQAVASFPEYKENIALGELCRVFYQIKENDTSHPSREGKFVKAITERLGTDASEPVSKGGKDNETI